MDGITEGMIHKKIKYAIRRDKKRHWRQQLNKEDWREVRMTKKEYMPRHTRLKHADGTVGTSRERPEILADFFETSQWGGVITEKPKEGYNKNKHYRNNMLFSSVAEIRTDDYTIEELDEVQKKC